MIRIEKNVGVLLGVGDGVDSRYRHSWYVFEMVSSRDVIESVQSVDSRWRAFYIYRQSTPNCRLVYTPSARATSTWRDVHRVKKPVGLIEKWQCVSEKILCRDFQTGLLLYENEFAITYFFIYLYQFAQLFR